MVRGRPRRLRVGFAVKQAVRTSIDGSRAIDRANESQRPLPVELGAWLI